MFHTSILIIGKQVFTLILCLYVTIRLRLHNLHVANKVYRQSYNAFHLFFSFVSLCPFFLQRYVARYVFGTERICLSSYLSESLRTLVSQEKSNAVLQDS
jgi:hypothetical protein